MGQTGKLDIDKLDVLTTRLPGETYLGAVPLRIEPGESIGRPGRGAEAAIIENQKR